MVQPRATPPLVPPAESGRCGLPSAENQGVRTLTAVQRRRDHRGGREAVRRPSARPLDRIRGAVRIRGRADRPGRLAAAPPEYAERLRGHKYVRLDTGREPGNAPAAFPGLRHRVMSDGEQWADVDHGSGYKSEHDRIEPEMRRSHSAGEMAPELAVLRRPAARASRSIGNA